MMYFVAQMESSGNKSCPHLTTFWLWNDIKRCN